MTQLNNNVRATSLISVTAALIMLSTSTSYGDVEGRFYDNLSPLHAIARNVSILPNDAAQNISKLNVQKTAQRFNHLNPYSSVPPEYRNTRAATNAPTASVRFGARHDALKPTPKMRPTNGVFGTVAISFGKLPKIERLNAITQSAHLALTSCAIANCTERQKQFEQKLNELQALPFNIQVASVNKLVNSYVTYRRDSENYKSSDYWASVDETLMRGSGDCEDYAILKLAALERLGIPANSMSIVVLHDERRRLFHAVLTVRTTEGNFVLDNLRPNVAQDKDLAHYTPLYSISAGRGYIHGRRNVNDRAAMKIGSFDMIAPGEGP